MRVLSHSDTHTTSIGIWYSAGVTKRVTSPAAHRGIWHGAGATKGVTNPTAHRGIWHGAGATKSWFHFATLKKSYALIKKRFKATEIFDPDDTSITQRSQSNTNWSDKTSGLVISERVWRVYSCMLAHWICLYFSLFFCAQTLTLVAVDSSSFKIEEFLHIVAIFLKYCPVEQKNQSSLATWNDQPVSGDHLLRLLDIFPDHLSLGSTASFGRPSASFGNSFILSLHLTMLAASLSVMSKTQLQKAFSPNAGALAFWHSPPPWVYWMMRVPRDLECTHLVDRSLLPWSKNVLVLASTDVTLWRQLVLPHLNLFLPSYIVRCRMFSLVICSRWSSSLHASSSPLSHRWRFSSLFIWPLVLFLSCLSCLFDCISCLCFPSLMFSLWLFRNALEIPV